MELHIQQVQKLNSFQTPLVLYVLGHKKMSAISKINRNHTIILII